MKYDIKNILIVFLLVISMFFGYKWYFGKDDGVKERIKELDKQYNKLEEDKKNVDKEIIKWREKFITLKNEDDKLKSELSRLSNDVTNAERVANKSKNELNQLKGKLSELRKRIEEFKKNPPNREGDALLESIKNRTK